MVKHGPRLLSGMAAVALFAAPLVVGTTAAASTTPPANLDPGLRSTGAGTARVVVAGRPDAGDLVTRAVRTAGGQDLRGLPIVNGVVATVPRSALAGLASATGVTSVTADRQVNLSGNNWDDTTTASSYAWTSGATDTWQATGTKGAGVSVAVLDTGVSEVNDLRGRVMHGPDLSGEERNAVDSYGHGTVMAGIIAGDGADSQPAPRTGIAPATQIISVKVAGANGSTDVSTVLAGLSWVGAFKDTYNIRVLNLSWGVASTQNPSIDPLNYAVERLWTLGVTVVVAAGNSGPNAGTVLKPGDDPLVITAGAYNDNGDSSLTNDALPTWSSRGPTAQGVSKPDVVAPGRTLIATRAPGSTVEAQNPRALVGGSYIKGSGTSESAAVVSGLSALLLSAHPDWTPDQVKAALMRTALPLGGVATSAQGAGRVQAASAVNANVSGVASAVFRSDGTGTLVGSRGASAPVSITCNGTTKTLDDETTTWCAPWDSSAWTSTAWTSSAWTSTAWTSTAWTSSAWTSTAWTSTAWTSTAWTSSAWTSTAWTSSAWTSSAWTGSEYDDETAFLSAFWGSHPKFGKKVRGEKSEPYPWYFRGLF